MAKLMTTWQNIAIPSLNADTRGATAAFRSAREGFTDWQSAVDKRATNQALQDLLDPSGNVNRDNLGAVQGRSGVNYADLLDEVRAAELGQRQVAAEGRAVETHADNRAMSAAELAEQLFKNEKAPEIYELDVTKTQAEIERAQSAAGVNKLRLGALTDEAADKRAQDERFAALDQQLAAIRSAPWPMEEQARAQIGEQALRVHRNSWPKLDDARYARRLKLDMPGIQRTIDSNVAAARDAYYGKQEQEVLKPLLAQQAYAGHPLIERGNAELEAVTAAQAAEIVKTEAELAKRRASAAKDGQLSFTLVNGDPTYVPEGARSNHKIDMRATKSLATRLFDDEDAAGFVGELARASGGDMNVLMSVVREYELDKDPTVGFDYWKDEDRQAKAIAKAEETAAMLKGEAANFASGVSRDLQPADPLSSMTNLLEQGQSNNANLQAENERLKAALAAFEQAAEQVNAPAPPPGSVRFMR
jgi:hypothetical protein